MANGVKTFKIVINGLAESIDGVDSLNKQLEALENRMKALEGKGIGASTGGSGGSRRSELSEQEKIEKQIAQIQEKQAAYRSEEYKALLMEKDALKQITTEMKSQAAASKGDGYNLNTMQGMKERLRDLKLQHNTTDINDDLFKQQTREINELTQKLKDLEAEYGVYSRNVGNYANGVTEGIKHARQELRDLKTEMQDLANKKANGIISEEEEERLKAVVHEYNNMKSTLEDANKPMDAMMDTMQSMVAIASTAKGFSAFFGLDGDKVEESLKKLMALQNAMQGLQTLQKQMQTGEGFGKYLSSANSSIDKFVAKITKAKIGVNGLEKSTKTATLAVKGFSTALKATGIGLAVWIGSEIIDGIGKFIDNLKAADKAAEEFKQTLDDIADKSLAEGIGARTDIDEFISKMKVASGSTAQEKKIIDELNKSYGDLMGHYYTLSQWFDVLNTKREEYAKLIEEEKRLDELRTLYETTQQAKEKAIETRKQAEAQVTLNHQVGNGIIESIAYTNALKAEAIATHQATLAAIQYKAELFLINRLRAAMEREAEGHPESGGTTTAKTVDAEKEVQNLRLKYMKDGLNKRMMQLDEEKRQTLAKLKNNQKQYLEAEKIFEEQRLEIIKEYSDEIAKKIAESTQNIKEFGLNIDKNKLEAEANEIARLIDEGLKKIPPIESGYTEPLAVSFGKRMDDMITFHEKVVEAEQRNSREKYALLRESALKELELQRETEEKRYSAETESNKKTIEDARQAITKIIKDREEAHKQLTDEDEKNIKKLHKIQLDADKNAEKIEKNHTAQMELIQLNYNNSINKLIDDENNEQAAIDNQYYDVRLSDFRNYLAEVNDLISKQPERNIWKIVNYKKTKQNLTELKEAVSETLGQIDLIVKDATEKYKDSNPDIYNAVISTTNDIKKTVEDTAIYIKEKEDTLLGDLINSINNYVQELGNAIQTVMQAVNDYQDYQLDKQQAYLEDSIDYLEKKLSEQEAILQKHKDNVNSIEDELSSARGDRRQHLIDQLNAEIAAQREAAAEQKRIEKEKQKEQDKLDELDKKRKEQEYDRNLRQIRISGALATANGLATQPFVPVGIAMGALAASLAAVQYALAKKQKPYAKGGLLEGASHKEGGIPVGNTGIEVEGKEYVIRKKSTAENVPVLDFINRAERKLTLDDFIDFYSSKPKATIKNIRSKFADGGVLPNNIDIRDQISDVVMVQSEQPIYVTVKDIENGLDRVARVRELAGVGK